MLHRIRWALASALFLASLSTAQTQLVQSYALNPYVPDLEGQWEGIKFASDGNVYFASSSRSSNHGAAFFKYTSSTKQVTMLTDDITKVCGENPLTNPQGKIHSDIVEANGWLYFSTYFANDSVPGAYASYTGSHVIGYQLATGTFRDYGVVLANHTSYSGVAVDPVRNYLYVYVTGESPGQVSYIFRIDTITGAKSNLGQVGGTYSSCFYLFLDQRGDVWFSVEYGNGSLKRVHGDTGVIDTYTNVLPPIYSWSVPVIDPSSTNQSLRQIHWMQPLDGNRAVFTLGYYGGMLYIFDSSKPIGSGQEFTAVQHIGYTDLNLALGNNRVFYHQRANRGCGHQGDGQQTSICGPAPAGGVKDLHLLSVSLNAADNYAITDYGLIQDQGGRLLWRAPGMNTDRANRVFFIGDWYTIPGDVGSTEYLYSSGTYGYVHLDRGQFFAVADVGAAPFAVSPPSATLGSGQTQQFNATSPATWSISGQGTVTASGLYTAPALVASNQTVTITATGGSLSATATVYLNPPGGNATASFVSLDAATHGSWKGTYGAEGAVIAADSTNPPGYAQVALSGQLPYTWLPSTQDVNCLQKYSAADRLAAVWYSANSFVIDINVAGAPRQVGLYALDWDGAHRVERIDVLDAVSGVQLDTRTLTSFSTGAYVIWNISGHVQFRITKLGGPNAVISGVFFGGGSGAPLISLNPSNSSVTAGQTATFTVVASGAGLSYQWQSQVPGASGFSNVPGANGASYTTPGLGAADTGTQFRCVVSNTAGSLTSTAAMLTVGSVAPVITQNPSSVSVTAGQTTTFLVAASGSGLSYQWQSQLGGGFTNIPGATGATYTTGALGSADNGTQFRCVVTNGGGAATSSAALLTVTPAVSGGGNSAGFAAADTTTRGTWKGTYGGDGFAIASDVTSLPSYAQVTLTGQLPYVWSASTQDPKCLQKAVATDRIAAVWYSASSFTIDINVSGSAPHQVALYALDWDLAGRVERVDVLDGSSGQVLDTRTVSTFSNGTFLVWNVVGHLQFRVTRISGPNAVLSGIFFGPGSTTATLPAIGQSPAGVQVTAGQTATFAVTATGGSLTYQWQAKASGAVAFASVSGAVGASYTTPALALADSGTQYQAVVTNSAGSATSNPAAVTVNPQAAGSSAVYIATDTTTLGAWKSGYGVDGYSIAGGAVSYPAYAQVNLTGASLWQGGTSSTDPRAVQNAGIIACWYAWPQFTVDLNLADSNTHRIALYLVDWGSSVRNQTVTVRDAVSGAVLDTRTVASFVGGQYLVWNVKGHVTLTIAVNSGPNAVLSGVFFQ